MKNQASSMAAEIQDSNVQEVQMIAYLADLLERQLERLRKYDLDGAVALAEESQKVSGQVATRGLLERPQYSREKQHIQGLYQDLCLVIAAERQEVGEKLKQIREGIRALARYETK
jgi:hypothetical protein